jgi:hypothetical protein
VTYLLIEPHGRHDLARLVPAGRAHDAPAEDGSISLDCAIAEIAQLEPLRRIAYMRLGEHPEEDPIPGLVWHGGERRLSKRVERFQS